MCLWVKGEGAQQEIKEVRAATPGIILKSEQCTNIGGWFSIKGLCCHRNSPIQWLLHLLDYWGETNNIVYFGLMYDRN